MPRTAAASAARSSPVRAFFLIDVQALTGAAAAMTKVRKDAGYFPHV
jgi:hypothetical protein